MLIPQYFAAAAGTFRGGILSLIPFIGLVCLLAGAVAGIVERRRALWFFSFPFIVSECYVAIAGFYHGRLSGDATLAPICMFGFLQIALIAYLAYRLRSAGLAVWPLTVFSLSYAFFAYFVGQMLWTDTYL